MFKKQLLSVFAEIHSAQRSSSLMQKGFLGQCLQFLWERHVALNGQAARKSASPLMFNICYVNTGFL